MLSCMYPVVIFLAVVVLVAAVLRAALLVRRLVRLRTTGPGSLASARDLAAVRAASLPSDMGRLARGTPVEAVVELRQQTRLTPRQCVLALDLTRSGEL